MHSLLRLFNPKSKMMLITSLFTFIFALVTFGTATTYKELELADMLKKADIAFSGIVKDIKTELRDGEPWTLVDFTVARDLKAETNKTDTDNENKQKNETITLAFYGGSAEGYTLNVTGMPTFQTNEEMLVLAYNAPYYSPIVGFSQGLWQHTPQGFVDERGRTLTLTKEQRASTNTEQTDMQLDSADAVSETAVSETAVNETTDNNIDTTVTDNMENTEETRDETTQSESSQETTTQSTTLNKNTNSEANDKTTKDQQSNRQNNDAFPILLDGVGSNPDAVLDTLATLLKTLKNP